MKSVQLAGKLYSYGENKRLSYRRDRGARSVIVFPKRRRLELGDNILQTL